MAIDEWKLLFATKRKQVQILLGVSREFGGGAAEELLGLVNCEVSGEWRAGRRVQPCRRDPTHVRQSLGGVSAAAQKRTEKILAAGHYQRRQSTLSRLEMTQNWWN